MKKVLLDCNILDKNKIQKMLKTNLSKKLNRALKFYISETLLKQRLIELYNSKYSKDYDFYIDFIKTWCGSNIVDSASEIVKQEISNNFSPAKILSNFKTSNLHYLKQAKTQLVFYKQELTDNKKRK